MKELSIEKYDFELIDIKKQNIAPADLDFAFQQTNSYEALFNKRAQKWKSFENKETLKDEDYRALILNEYTFLKRPLVIYDNQIYAGNAKSTIADLSDALLS